MTDATTVRESVASAHRHGWALVLAATARVARDLHLAEECVQEAYASALSSWGRTGIPLNPEAWLTTTAKRRAMDAIRREHVLRTKLPLLVGADDLADEGAPADSSDAVPDERLRLIFLCCHPALPQDGQLALTLRLVCGLSTADIARVFLVSESTMAARLTRAKKKIVATRIPFRIPAQAELPDRLRGALEVIHALFTAGHTAPSGPTLMRTTLVDEALRLARMLRELMPDECEIRGLLALILITDARRATRVDGDGRLLRLEDQDRSLWDHAAIAESHDLIIDGLRAGPPGRYLLQAAIASLYAEAQTYEQTDWSEIVTLYDRLLEVWPSPVVALNRTVSLSMIEGPAAALAAVDELERDPRLGGYPYVHAVKADLLHRLGRDREAESAYRQTLALTGNEAERDFLAERIRRTAEPH